MFLFDPTFGASFENCEAEVRRLMERAGAELLFCQKWDERRLAYRIQGRKRGVYVLTYFKAPSEKIASLERDVQLAENTLRVLVLRAEGVTTDAMEKALALGSERPGDDSGFDRPRDRRDGRDNRDNRDYRDNRDGGDRREGRRAPAPVGAAAGRPRGGDDTSGDEGSDDGDA